MKNNKLKLTNKKYILRVKKVILFDDTELFEENNLDNITYLTEEQLDILFQELK